MVPSLMWSSWDDGEFLRSDIAPHSFLILRLPVKSVGSIISFPVQLSTKYISRPLYRTQTDQWRALSNGSPIPPGTAFSYIFRSFRQTTPHIIGALKLLAGSFSVQELNSKAWSLYADFRPAVDQWGKRSEVKCSTILALRKTDAGPSVEPPNVQEVVKFEDQNHDNTPDMSPEPKRTKTLTLEEYL